MGKVTVDDYRKGVYKDENGIVMDWDTLVATVKYSAGGCCSSLEEALNSGLRYHTNNEIEEVEDLPDELQEELFDEQYCCEHCGWTTYPGDMWDCGYEEEEEE